MHQIIESNRGAIPDLCRRHGVRRLEVFGSVLRDDFDPKDVDILVEFDPDVAGSCANFLELKDALEALFGRNVDLVELEAIGNRRLRQMTSAMASPGWSARPLSSSPCRVAAMA